MQGVTERIADEVRGIAAKHRASQARLAEITGLSRNAISMRMTGKTPFTAPELYKIAIKLGEPIDAFFPAVAA